MKKFLITALSAFFLIPSPTFATDFDQEMTEMTSEQESEEIMDDNSVEEIMDDEELESSTALECTITFKTKDGVPVDESITLPFKNQVISTVELIKNIPSGYGFSSELKDLKSKKVGSSTTIYVVPLSNSWYADNDKVPCLLSYKGQEDEIHWIEFSSWKDAASNNTISTKTLNAKLKEIDSKLPYTIEKTVNLGDKDLEAVLYQDGSTFKVAGYRFTSPRPLKKADVKDLSSGNISVQLGNEICDLHIKDFKTNNEPLNIDKEGNIIVTKDNLQNALNAMATREKKNCTFKVNAVPEAFTLNGYVTKAQPITNADITIALSSSSYIGISLIKQDGTIAGTSYVQLNAIDTDKSNADGYRKVSLDEMRAYLKKTYSNRLSLANNSDQKTFNFTAVNFLEEGYVPVRSINVVPTGILPESLYNQSFTLSFVDSQTGKSVDSATEAWSAFFKKSPQEVLTNEILKSSYLPNGYGIALSQVPYSTKSTQAQLSSLDQQGDIAISVFGPTKVTIYVTKLENYSDKPLTNITTKPVAPTQPSSPQTPATPPKPTQTQDTHVMFRLYNTQTQEHFYTRSAEEKADLLKQDVWSDEGHGWISPSVSSDVVYRLFNPNTGEHHYTKDQNEYETLIQYGWNGEGHGFYSADDVNNKVTIYRLYNSKAPTVAQHHYTASKEERDKLLQDGWKDEGIGWYGMPAQ